ncbi:MAG TPA: hypothetical protein VLK33_16405 [Terriglobales bacterium]|nr:hypothetical protein [Terriglobales bacterium]
MKALSLSRHLGIALVVLVATLVIFTFLPHLVPAPEPLSPFVYLAAAIVVIVGLFRIRPRRLIWIYLPLFLLTIFGFLEETSYGVESGVTQPIYSDTYHVEVYDVHNLIPILEQILDKDLQNSGWDIALLGDFLRADLFILVGLIAFGGFLQARSRAENTDHDDLVLKGALLLSLFFALSAIAWLLSLPADSKNALLFGYSAIRLLSIAMIFLLGMALPIAALASKKSWSQVRSRISEVVSSKFQRRITYLVMGLLLAAGITYQIAAPLRLQGEAVLLDRLNPVILWAMALCALSIFLLASWAGGLQSFLARAAKAIKDFFSANPAYVYVIVCVIVVGFAQLMDQDRISLAQFIPFKNPWGEEWNYWIEETLELSGAMQLMAASIFLNLRSVRSLEN